VPLARELPVGPLDLHAGVKRGVGELHAERLPPHLDRRAGARRRVQGQPHIDLEGLLQAKRLDSLAQALGQGQQEIPVGDKMAAADLLEPGDVPAPWLQLDQPLAEAQPCRPVPGLEVAEKHPSPRVADGAADIVKGIVEEGRLHGASLDGDVDVDVSGVVGVIDYLGSDVHAAAQAQGPPGVLQDLALVA
jgi:hypothetical protein